MLMQTDMSQGSTSSSAADFVQPHSVLHSTTSAAQGSLNNEHHGDRPRHLPCSIALLPTLPRT